MVSPTLHVICGKPGAGKTTLARELGKSLPAIVFCEDAWISTLGFDVATLQDFLDASARVRQVIASIVPDLLRQGVSVVFDFGGNTVRGRAWIRSLFEAAGADHRLHWMHASDEECLANIHRRNDEKPAGIYWGPVSDEMFHAVNPHIVPPAPEEGFRMIRRTLRVSAEDLQIVDRSLKTHGNFGGALGDFSGGLAPFLGDHTVTIEEAGAKLHLTIVRDGSWDFSVTVDRASGNLENAVLGTAAPEPSEEP